MGQKNSKGSVSIMNDAGRLRLRWRYQKERYSISLITYTKQNLLLAKKTALQIEEDIIKGCFDKSLGKYRAYSEHKDTEELSLVTHFERWVKNYRNMDCDRDIDYYSTRSMMRKWQGLNASNAVHHFNQETFSPSTYNRRLILLKGFFEWATKQGITSDNPFEDVLPKKVRKTEKPARKPFTTEEIGLILNAFKNDQFTDPSSGVKHSHYYPFVYFIFKLGVRNAEAVGLRVKHIDINKNLIYIQEVLARTIKGSNAAARIRKETKNGKERALPLTDDLKEVLLPLLKQKRADDLVFLSPRSNAIDDDMFQKRIFSRVLSKLNIERRVLYACRHTFGSRCIEEGLTPVMTAFLMGNNPETALRNYTHQIGLPSSLPKI